jgi:predicted transcriptional regulator
MGITKTQIFTTEQNELASILKVLGNNQRDCICNDIVAEIGLAQPTISQHLKELKSIDLIEGEISGKRVCYCINQEKWQEILVLLNDFFDKTNVNCC